MLKKVMAFLICAAVLMSFAGCEDKNVEESTKTLSVYTDIMIFEDIPCMDEENLCVVDDDDYGSLDYLLVLSGMKKDGYDAYVKKLTSAGYTVYADNGPNGIGNSIYSTTFTKDNKSLTVSYMPRLRYTYIYVTKDKPLSPHMVYDASYTDGNKPDAKTTLTMHQLG